jgi:hypothetical protein
MPMEDVKFRKYTCKEIATNMAQVETMGGSRKET